MPDARVIELSTSITEHLRKLSARRVAVAALCGLLGGAVPVATASASQTRDTGASRTAEDHRTGGGRENACGVARPLERRSPPEHPLGTVQPLRTSPLHDDPHSARRPGLAHRYRA